MTSKLQRILVALALVGVLAFAFVSWTRVLFHRGSVGSVQQLAFFAIPPYAYAPPVMLALLTAVALFFRRELIQTRTLAAALYVALFSLASALIHPLGYEAVIAAVALVVAVILGVLSPELRAADAAASPPGDRRIAVGLFLLITLVDALYAMHRYYWFGAGSWDLGCEIHNAYRSSHFYDSTSTVLGNVDYLGDHFMIGIYLWAPLFWISSSGYMVLFLQCINLAAVGPVVYLLARDKGAPVLAAAVLGLASGFAFGVQSAVYFDAHEINFGFGFLAVAILAFERKRLALASVLLGAFVLFKESLGAYVAALGLLALWRGIRDNDRRHLQYGAAWIAGGVLWFVLVNRVFMPYFIARANRPEPHETFSEFGPTVFQAALGMLSNPFKAIGALFVPEEKTASLLVTFGGLGYLAFLSPEILLAAIPLLMERFLSSKATMWEMGYHYAAPLTLYSAWASAIGWPKAALFSRRAVDAIAAGLSSRVSIILPIYLLISTALMNSIGYRHPANFHEWMHGYFSTPERRETNANAVAFLNGFGKDAKLAVQNRTLPHLADRAFIYRLGDYRNADFVLLVINESAWPWDDNYPMRLAHELGASPEWKLIFSEGYTAVFARAKATDSPAVRPSSILENYLAKPESP
jgi:uncharacterized membrane protein